MSTFEAVGSRGPQGAVASQFPVIWKAQAYSDSLNPGDGLDYLAIPPELDGYNLVNAQARLVTVGTSTTTIQIANVTQAADMLSTRITLDANEVSSGTAAVPRVIDLANDDVAAYDLLRVDVDGAGSGAKGLIVFLTFERP